MENKSCFIGVQVAFFTPAERTTAADRDNDRRSVQRRLDAPLRLITQIALGNLKLSSSSEC